MMNNISNNKEGSEVNTLLAAVMHIGMLTGLFFEKEREKEIIQLAIYNAGLHNFHEEAKNTQERLDNEIFECDVIYYYKIHVLNPIDDVSKVRKLRDEHTDISLRLRRFRSNCC